MSERTRRRGEIFGSWLDGPASVQAGTGHPGQRLGLPESGPGSVATLGNRLGATLIDLVIGVAIGGTAYAFDHHANVIERNLVATASVLLQWLILWPTTGQTLGMRLRRIRMVNRSGRPPQLRWCLLRVLLLVVPVPFATSFTLDGDNRGIQDKATGVTVINV